MLTQDKQTSFSAEEARRAYQREWRKNNKDKVKAIQNRYWAKKAAKMQDTQK